MKKLLLRIIMPFLLFFSLMLYGCSSDIKENNTEDTVDNNANSQVTQKPEDNSAVTDQPKAENNQALVFRDDLESLFSNLALAASLKKEGENNPLITQDFGADPFAMVYKDRVYVYMTQDVLMYDTEGNIKENSYGLINKLRCISSADMVNWTDHGNIHIGGIKGVSLWARNSWAPSAVWKNIDGKDQFFIYFANGAGGIGVLTSDSPTGPFRDPLGKALITHSTPGCADVVWLFDPAVLVDDDGKAYLYFGGGIPEGMEHAPKTARVIQLGDDMISTVGEAAVIDAPYLFEDSGINKIGDKYYYSYCTNFSNRANAKGEIVPPPGEIAYMISDNPMGPWQYQKTILKNPGYFFGTGGNNHHSMVQFKGKWYMFYHAFLLQDAKGIKGGYRSTNVDEVIMASDGIIEDIKATRSGVEQIEWLNPYQKLMATTMSANGGIGVVEEERRSFKEPVIVSLGDIEDGDWIRVSGVDFGENGPASFTIKYSSDGGAGAVKVVSDSLEGDLITYAEIKDTGGYGNYSEVTVPVKSLTGVHDIYMIFAGSGYHINEWSFSK